MLKKQKEVLKQKKENGKKWIKEHKGHIGLVAGICISAGFDAILSKILEPKVMEVQTTHNPSLENDNFAIRVAGENRFGHETYHSPWVRYEDGLEDKERIDEGIMQAINREKGTVVL